MIANVAPMFPTVAKPQRRRAGIDADLLKVEHNVPLPGGRSAADGKYHKHFALMKPGSCIRCEAGEINQVANALRKQIQMKRYPALTGCVVRSAARCEDGAARVWAIKL